MLTEQIVLAEVAHLPASDAVNVRWDVLILRDGEVISRVPHRKAYSRAQRAEFAAEVDGAEAYLVAIGW